jgi:hypothetical protein
MTKEFEIRSPTKKRQDEVRELGRSAGKYATKKLQEYLKKQHCESDDECDEFDKGVEEAKNG